MACETGAAALTVRMRCGGGGTPRCGADGGGGGGVDRECDGGSFETAVCTRERGGGCATIWEEAGRGGGGGGAARFGVPSKEDPVGRGGGGGGWVPRAAVLECEGGRGGTLRAGRLGGAGVVGGGGSDEGVATVLEGGGGTGRPMVDDLTGGGGGAGATGGAGGGAVRLGGNEGRTLLVAALDPDASVAAETSDGAARGARGGARCGSWNGRSGGGGGGSVGAGADPVAERGIGGGFARPVILANHQHQHQHQYWFKKLHLLVAFIAAGFSFGIPPAKSPPSCGGPPVPPVDVEGAPLDRPGMEGAAIGPRPAPPPILPPAPPPAFLPSICGTLRS